MPVGSNTYANITEFVNDVFEDVLFTLRDNNLMLPLVTTYDDRTGMATRKFQEYGTASMATVGELDDLASQAFTPVALAELTPSEAGAQFLLTDQRLETDPFNVRAEAARELGLAAAAKMETDLISDFPDFTGGTIGAAGTVLTWGHFFAGLSRLRTQLAPMPWAYVMHPYQWHVLGKAVTPAATTVSQTNAPDFQNEVMRVFWVGRAAGVDLYTSNNVPIDGSGDAIGAMFSRSALAIDMRRAPRLEPERDASRRAWELNLSMIYAHGVIRAKHGIQMIFDAATPES